MKLIHKTVEEYIEKAKDKTSIPGGGSVAALCGSLCASLAIMVLKLSNAPESAWGPYERISSVLKDNIDRDSTSFDDVLKAFRLPKATEGEMKRRSEAIQKGYITAIEVPLSTMEKGSEMLSLLVEDLPLMGEEAFSDILIAADLARTCVRGAAHTVAINLKALKDLSLREEYENRLDALRKRSEKDYRIITEY